MNSSVADFPKLLALKIDRQMPGDPGQSEGVVACIS
jgi:hypothetical protein